MLEMANEEEKTFTEIDQIQNSTPVELDILEMQSSMTSLIISDDNVLMDTEFTLIMPLEILDNNEIVQDTHYSQQITDIDTIRKNELNAEEYTNKKRNKRAEPENWNRIKNKKLRMTGQQYKGFAIDNVGKIKNNIERPARHLGPRCNCHGSKKQRLCCESFSEENRVEIFNFFWNLSWGQKKCT